jgi:hypothetical protein
VIKDFALYLVIAILAVIVLRGCDNKKGGGEDKIIISSDTVIVYIEGQPDTIEIERVRIVYRDREPDGFTTSIDTTGDTVKTYITNFSDSLLDGAIVTAKVKGTLISSSFTYRPLFPKYITRVDTIKESVVTVKERDRYEVSIGAVAGASSEMFSFTPSVMVRTRKKFSFSVGYDLLNNTYHVGGFSRLGF